MACANEYYHSLVQLKQNTALQKQKLSGQQAARRLELQFIWVLTL